MQESHNANRCFNAAINFACQIGGDGVDFLRFWREGCWAEIEEYWPEFRGPIPSSMPAEEAPACWVTSRADGGQQMGLWDESLGAYVLDDGLTFSHKDLKLAANVKFISRDELSLILRSQGAV